MKSVLLGLSILMLSFSANAMVLVYVSKPAQGKQCQPNSRIPLELHKRSLMNERIKVFKEMQVPGEGFVKTACGEPDGYLNVFGISPAALEDAEAVGFQEYKPQIPESKTPPFAPARPTSNGGRN